jgi:hypothetical protein
MYGLTTIKGLINHQGLKLIVTVFAIAAFISLSALSAPAQAPTEVGDYIFLTGNTVELAKAPSVNVDGGLQLEMTMSLRRALYGDSTVVYGGAIGLAPGQTVRVTVPNFYFMDGSVRFLKHSIKVYEVESSGVTENESGLIYSGESGGMNELEHEYGHIFTLSYGDLPVRREVRTGRVEVWIMIESFPRSETQKPAEDRSSVVLPTFELIEGDGRKVLFGLLLPAIMKVRDKNGL